MTRSYTQRKAIVNGGVVVPLSVVNAKIDFPIIARHGVFVQ